MINSMVTIEWQAKVYLFDLNNCAREYGFKADERWELNLSSKEEKAELEKRFHPIISTEVLPEMVQELFDVVNKTLQEVKLGIANLISFNLPGPGKLQYMVAYNPKRTALWR